MIKLFISVYNRPEYLKRSLDSLMESFDIIYPEIIISDDGSTNPETQVILNDLLKEYYPGKISINKYDHKGIPFGKLDPIKQEIFHPVSMIKEDYFLISDSDMIYKRGWIETLVNLYKKTGAPLITGFNTLTNNHKTLEEYDNYVIKQSVGGCNLLVDIGFYLEHPFIEPREWDYKMCECAHKQHKLGVVASKPSVVDHIGVRGVWARENYHDSAIDFNNEI